MKVPLFHGPSLIRLPTAQGKQEKWQKEKRKIPVGENREFGNFAKTQGIWCTQVQNSKDKGYCEFAGKFPYFL